MTVIDFSLKPKRSHKRAPRDLMPLDKSSGAARFFDKMTHEIEVDLGGRRELTRIEGELIRAFAGAATLLRYLNHQILLGDGSEIDLNGYATIASTMLRIGTRLGFRRHEPEPPSMQDYLHSLPPEPPIEDKDAVGS